MRRGSRVSKFVLWFFKVMCYITIPVSGFIVSIPLIALGDVVPQVFGVVGLIVSVLVPLLAKEEFKKLEVK